MYVGKDTQVTYEPSISPALVLADPRLDNLYTHVLADPIEEEAAKLLRRGISWEAGIT